MEKLSKAKESKIARKQKRCQAIVTKDTGIVSSATPTKFLAICNAGISTGLEEETLLNEVLQHGRVDRVVMVPNKSYCFLCCSDIHSAEEIYKNMNANSKLAQNNGVIYFSYVVRAPTVQSSWGRTLPPGLILLEEFITAEEECQLLDAVKDSEVIEGALKHRKVRHFGYEFLYGSNQVDSNCPLEQKIPNACGFLWSRLKQKMSNLSWHEPDQLTVNQYAPGQGIPPHVDTHSAFLDPILSLSLEGDTVMEFKKQNEHVSINLPKRSLLIVSGESRYDWTHGIVPRRLDFLPSPSGGLIARHRENRTSLTFRKLRRAPCDCTFPTHCDTRKDAPPKSKLALSSVAQKLELYNVHKVYDEIADHFSETRHSPWPKVSEFLNSFPQGSILLDIGCGNGKYLKANENVAKIGCDRSEGLLRVCSNYKYNVFKCDCLSVPFRDASIDGCFSIAVIHHLASEERRLKAIREMARILVKGGRALIYVWSKNQQADAKRSTYLRQNKAINKNRKTEEELRSTEEIQKHIHAARTDLPIHTNRTQFQEQDVFVPWKLKSKNQDELQGSTFLRFYHVFEEGELVKLCEEVEGIEVNNCYYDQGNWSVIFMKL